MPRLIKIAVIFIGALLVIGSVAAWYSRRNDNSKSGYRTAVVSRGDLTATIAATGTVEPVEVVDVGAQVAGQINFFGKDKNGNAVDYGSPVEEGTVLAQIDDSLYAADVGLAKASLEQAQAGQTRAEADLVQMQAKLDQAQRDWERAQKLGPSEALAPTQFDAYKAGYETAKANVAVGQAAIGQARAAVAQAQASLDRAQRNLSYCTIKSPVKGVVIDRRVNIGQTVVSSLNAPSLFLIAKDLTRIQVWVAVNEADIGSITPGKPVTFTVDAFPDRQFEGHVGKIRLNATMTQNVVTYTVEVNTDNADGRLLPYLTANLQFQIGSRSDVLTVPNAALRWTPQVEQVAPEYRAQLSRRGGRSGDRGAASSQPAATSGPATAPTERPNAGTSRPATVWRMEGQFLKPVAVTAGLTDGIFTEVQGADVREGMEVVIGAQVSRSAGGPSGGASPFTPQMGRFRRPANPPAGEGGGAGGPGGGGGGAGRPGSR